MKKSSRIITAYITITFLALYCLASLNSYAESAGVVITSRETVAADVTITRAKKITAQYSLTQQPLNCLTFKVQDDITDEKTIVDIREHHSNACGGDAETSLRLFSVAFSVNASDKRVWSDAKSLLGEMELLDVSK